MKTDKKRLFLTAVICMLFVFVALTVVSVGVLADKYGMQDEYPHIIVDTGDNAEIPYAIVGKGYEIFPATATGEKSTQKFEVTKAVYFNYYSDKRINVTVSDGKFVPAYEGVYSIVYTAVNGKIAKERIVDVTAVNSTKLGVTLPSHESEYTIGDVAEFSMPEVIGASGNYSFAVTADIGGEKYPLKRGENGFSFRIMKTGTCELTFAYRDHVQTYSDKFIFTVNAGTGYEIVERQINPTYLVNKGKYSFGKTVYYDLSDAELIAKTCIARYKSDKQVSETAYTYGAAIAIDANSEFTVNYYSNKNELVVSDTYDVLDASLDLTAGKIAPSALFVVTGGEFTRNDGTSAFPVFRTTTTSELTYANKVLTDNFRLSVKFITSGAGRYIVRLADYYDPTNVLEIWIEPRKDGVTSDVYVGGRYLMKAVGNFTNGDDFAVRYSSAGNTLTVSGSTAKLSGYFKGMTHALARFSIGLDKVASATEICVQSVNSQQINASAIADYIAAQCYVKTDGIYKTLGEDVTLFIEAADVLSPTTTATFSVRMPDNSYAVSSDGTTLKDVSVTDNFYTVNLSAYGRYRIVVSTDDNLQNTKTYTTNIYCEDRTAPEITANGIKSKAKVGETIEFTVSATDKKDGELSVKVAVFTPSAVAEKISGNAGTYSYKFTQSGVYVVSVYAYDGDENVGAKTYMVEVR
ncbi:MAG: hypothetical protein J5903_04010 [Clostridia bacterium]|nr:hypothetical protein [Clostridia bacterium]